MAASRDVELSMAFDREWRRILSLRDPAALRDGRATQPITNRRRTVEPGRLRITAAEVVPFLETAMLYCSVIGPWRC
jgi:hypothetical protein